MVAETEERGTSSSQSAAPPPTGAMPPAVPRREAATGPTRARVDPAASRAPLSQLLWVAATGSALLLGALWLRTPIVPYLAGAAAATALAVVVARRGSPRGPWGATGLAAMVLFCAAAAIAQRRLERIERQWAAEETAITRRGAAALQAELTASLGRLRESAAAALDAPDDPALAFAAIAKLPASRLAPDMAEQGVVLWRRGRPYAWGGRTRVPPDSLLPANGMRVADNGFYLTLQLSRTRGDSRVVASTVVHAEPPADRLALAADRVAERASDVIGFEWQRDDALDGRVGPGRDTSGVVHFAPLGRRLLTARAIPPAPGEARLRVLGRARAAGLTLLGLALVAFAAAVWGHRASLRRRLAALGVAFGVAALIPLNAFSAATPLFDPSFYYVQAGGPLTASVGALAVTSALALLAVLALLRSRARVPSRPVALLLVLAVAGAGPFMLRDLARGIAPPAGGVTLQLWLAWEVAIFLAATTTLLAGASAGRVALGGARGLSPLYAPLLAAAAALLAPLLWEAPWGWPAWYPVIWIAAIGALAMTRRARGFVLTAAAVAACGAATLVWGATARRHVELAIRDINGLGAPDAYARTLLERFAIDLQNADAPTDRAALLRRFVAADLAAGNFPVALTAWSPDGHAAARLTLGTTPASPPATVAATVAEAARTGEPIVRDALGPAGVTIVLAVPHDDGWTTSAVVGARTLLLPDDPYSSLLGIAADASAEPPYTLSLVETFSRAPRGHVPPRWTSEGNEMHGDWIVRTSNGPTRAHVEVALRGYGALVQRGTLIVLLNLMVAAVLWTLSALADGGLGRWVRMRLRGWAGSYRARLTIALFAFFIVPSMAFVWWSYRRLQGDDRQARELLVRQTLRAVSGGREIDSLPLVAARLDAPLLLYRDGDLRATSDPLYDALAPAGRLLRPDVFLSLALSDEVTTSRIDRVGGVRTLFGYRAVAGSDGNRAVLAAPARTDELGLDQRRRDLGVLVLFTSALGALGALLLSGVAARQFALPIGALRRAAIAVARGEPEPVPTVDAPAEFVPVFTAFRQMAADLGASQFALAEAQRRTAAVLRNVASGVVAVDATARVTLANPRAVALLQSELHPGSAIETAGSTAIAERVAHFVSGAGEEEGGAFDVELDGRQLRARLTRLSGGGAVLTVDDLTELARAQRVLAWGEMARQVAHEIKNPLTPIRLGVQHLRRARANPRVDFDAVLEQNVTRILAEIDRLDEIARAFSRYGTAPEEAPPAETVDIAAIARDVIALESLGGEPRAELPADAGAPVAAVAVRWKLAGAETPAFALARDEELREVLLNVLENARLAQATTVTLTVERSAGLVRVVVLDDGVGIAAEVMPRVFEPHFSTRTSGSGLGLAISRRLIDGWGGAITMESAPGAGTTVTVTLRADSTGAPR